MILRNAIVARTAAVMHTRARIGRIIYIYLILNY